MGGERNRGSHGGMGQPFGGGKASWKNTIWGDNLGETLEMPSILAKLY